MARIDYSIIGQKFNKLTVLDFDHITDSGKTMWLCQCDCGGQIVLPRGNLTSGHTKSCGCISKERSAENLIGRRFGRLVVLEYGYRDHERRRTYMLCECDCGVRKLIDSASLVRGNSTSCGCKPRELRAEDITGRRYGRLSVIRLDHRVGNRSYWLCECDCGNTTIVERFNITTGHTKSCGCLQRDATVTHGMSYDRLYSIWESMNRRCNNPNDASYYHYGGRGIFVCREWRKFENFRDWALENGYDVHLTIDRIDNDDGYYPENCRWADRVTQQNNRRGNRHITYNGVTHTLAEWSRILEVPYNRLSQRVRRGNMRDFEDYYGTLED